MLQAKLGRQQLSFTWKDIPAGSTAVKKNLSRRRPANPRRLEKKRISSLQPGTLSTFQPKAAHTAPTAPLFLHHTRIDKYAIEKVGINGQWRNKLFFIVIHRFSLVKAAMNNPGLCKSRINCLTGFDQCAKVLSKRIYDSKLGNEKNIGCLIVNYKTRRRSDTLKGSQRMGEGRIFLKTCRASLFNDDLSNEPNFCWIHLAVPLISRQTVKSS